VVSRYLLIEQLLAINVTLPYIDFLILNSKINTPP
jgi:hypothetical protein